MITVAFFDAKAYDKPSFEHYGSEHDMQFRFLETKLNEDTVELAKGCDAVCVFVNDTVNAAVIENCISTASVLGGSHKGCDMSGGIAGGIGNAIVRSCMSSTVFGPAEALFYNAEQFGAIGAAVGLVFKDSSIEATQAKMDVRTGSAIVYSRGFVGAVAIGAEAKLADCSCSGGPACGNFLPGTVEGKLNAN